MPLPRYQCPSCSTWHSDRDDPTSAAPRWLISKRAHGDHRKIYKCAFCEAGICISCYVRHCAQAHGGVWAGTPKGRRKGPKTHR